MCGQEELEGLIFAVSKRRENVLPWHSFINKETADLKNPFACFGQLEHLDAILQVLLPKNFQKEKEALNAKKTPFICYHGEDFLLFEKAAEASFMLQLSHLSYNE